MRRLTSSIAVAAMALVGACTSKKDLSTALWIFESPTGSVSTPLVTDSYIAFGNDAGVTVLTTDGMQKCVFDAHGEVVSAPRTDGHLIFFGSTNFLFYAIDADCKLVWKYPTRDHIKSDPLIVRDQVYFSSFDGHVYAADAATGALSWMFPPLKAAALPAPPVEEAPPPTKRAASALARAARHAKHKAPLAALLPKRIEPALSARVVPVPGAFSYSSPVIADDVLFVGNLDHALYALNAKTGAYLWHYPTGGAITSTPTVAGDIVYFGSTDSNIYAVRISDHALVWKIATSGWVNSSARLVDGVIYIGSDDGHVYAINAAKGTVLWKFEAKGPVIATPAPYKDLVFAATGTGDGAVYAIKRADQTLAWRFETAGKIESDLVIAQDRLYVTSTDKRTYAFDLSHMAAAPQ